MREHDARIIHSSDEANWRTPPELFEALDREFNFTLDAAADAANHLCPNWFGPGNPWGEEDCLIVPWAGSVFINPPYSRKLGIDITPFVLKAQTEARLGNVELVCAVLPFAPQTAWYRETVFGAALPAMEERRLPHRLSFLRPDGSKAANAGVNHSIVIWRPDPGYVGVWQPATRYWTYRRTA